MQALQSFGLIIYAIIAGSLLPIQAGINSQLAKNLGSPIWGALSSFCIGTIFLILFAVLTGARFPSLMQITTTPGWMWVGGIMGAFFVAATIILAPRLGAATSISLLIAGQMIMSLCLDHYGAIGFPTHPINVARAIGVVLLVAGVVLIRMF